MNTPEIIKQQMKARHFNNSSLARACDVTRSAVQEWLRGKSAPARDKQALVARVLGITEAELMNQSFPQQTPASAPIGMLSPIAHRVGQMYDQLADEADRLKVYAYLVAASGWGEDLTPAVSDEVQPLPAPRRAPARKP